MELNRREARFREWLKTYLQDRKYFVNNIESSTKNGIPDMYVVMDGTAFWLELKVDEDRTAPLIRKEQRVWGYKHERARGKSYFLHFVEASQLCFIYANPVVSVRVVGNYLQILDAPVMCFPKKNTERSLFSLVKGLPDPNN